MGELGLLLPTQGSCILGGTLKSESCPAVFKLGSSKPWDSAEGSQGPLRGGVGERGGKKGYTKQASFSGHPSNSSKQPHFCLVYILGLYVKFKFGKEILKNRKLKNL